MSSPSKSQKFRKLSFFKKFLLVLIVLLLVFLGIGFFTEKQLPMESKVLIKQQEAGKEIEDIQANPEKYQKMPCFELEFNGEKYCFDRSKAYFEKKYSSNNGGDGTIVLYFIPQALLNLPENKKSIRIDWHVDQNHRDDLNEPERFIRNYIKDSKVYFTMLLGAKNGEFADVSNLMSFDKISLYGNYKHVVNVNNKRIILRASIEPSNEYYKFIGNVSYQRPNQETNFEFHLVSNQKNQKEFLQTSLDIAKEFEQYLEKSKIN